MKASEELMLLLELNNFDIAKYKLKKQLEFENSGNLDLYKHKKFANLLVSHYTYKQDGDFLHKNPLTYRDTWPGTASSIDQFYITHTDISGDVTLAEFLNDDSFNEVNKESILFDVLDGWVEEYREASISMMENLREMIVLLPKKNKKYHKPSKIAFLFTVLLLIFTAMIFKKPDSLFFEFFEDINQLLYDVDLYSLLGLTATLTLATYAVLNNAFSRFIKDVRSEKNKHAIKTFDKWENDMKNSRLKQSGMLEDYVDAVIKNTKKTKLELSTLIFPEILISKFKAYVKTIEGKYDWMTKHYSTLVKILRLLFIAAIVIDIVFVAVGFLMISEVIPGV
ncbi:MAG: hypothetical protein QM489_01355 [Candidatus Izemoplasma sp.]